MHLFLCHADEDVDGPFPKRKCTKQTQEASPPQQVVENSDRLIDIVPNTQPSKHDLEKIASKIDTWGPLAICLGLEKPVRTEIERNHRLYENQKTEMLLKWKRKNDSKATWKELVRASLEVRDRQLAEDIVAICECITMT